MYIEILCMYTCTYSIQWYKLQLWGSWRSFCFFYKGDLFKNGKKGMLGIEKLEMISLDISQLHLAGFQSPN